MFPTYCSILAAGWLSSPILLWIAVGSGVVLLLGVGIYLLRKRRSAAVALVKHPFAKYIIVSVLAHLALGLWLLTSRLFEVTPLPPGQAVIVVDVGELPQPPATEPPKPWEMPPTEFAGGSVPELAERQQPQQVHERPEMRPVDEQHPSSPTAARDAVDEKVADFADSFADAPEPTAEPDIADLSDVEQTPRPDAASRFDQALSEPLKPSPQEKSPVVSRQVPRLNEQLRETQNEAESRISHVDNPVASAAEPAPDSESIVPQSAQPLPEHSTQAADLNRKARLQTPVTAVSVSREDRLPRARAAQREVVVRRRSDGNKLPVIYRDRWREDRLAVARARGGSEDTETAVRQALVWLSQAQAADGRWDASQYGSGRPVLEGGHDRGQTGIQADTATTGLALLAFLGAGHTHLEGEYAGTVRRGLDFLVGVQRSRTDGSLVGQATGYAAMYCHGIATLCISEAYSLTGEVSLRQPVRNAIGFTLASQHRDGGWRYRPQEPGDTSQLGWQLMALTSAHYAGFSKAIATGPTGPWRRASRYLDSVSWGANGGLAAYKPNMSPTRAMTAEALLCWLLLNASPDHPRIIEAANHLMSELPGQGRLNYYYWYYGTLGLYHLQDHHWQRWNGAITQQLLRLQRRDGSWPTEGSVWGNAGGSVYTTALSAMTLEVYYRYRPFAELHRVDRTARRR